MKKKLSFQWLFLFLPAALAICLAACKPEPDLPPDPHVSLINPFIGVWNDGGQYWQFKPDGAGGRAAAQAGPFSNDFSFFIYAGQDVRTAPSKGSLIIFDDNDITRYWFSITGKQVTLKESEKSPAIIMTLEQVSGDPQALSLTNPLIGEWSADWSLPGNEHNSYSTWSLKYRADGTLKVFHQGVGHQFENAYALRENTLVIFGEYRYSDIPVAAQIHKQENGKWHVQETQSTYGMAEWFYKKVKAAKWKQ